MRPTNPGFSTPGSSGNEVFDNKKATHAEVARFVQAALQRVVAPLAQKLDQQNAVLDAIFLYLAEVGICGVKIEQKEIADHYKKRLEEEQAKYKASYEAALKAAAEKQATVQPETPSECPTSDQSPVSS